MELRCPNCQATFEVDESHYNALLAQVRNSEFEAELQRRLGELAELYRVEELKRQTEERNRELAARNEADVALAAKDREIGALASQISELKAQLKGFEAVRKADMAGAKADSERKIIELKAENLKEVAELKEKRAKEIAELKESNAKEIARLKENRIEELHNQEKKIAELSAKLESDRLVAQNRELELREQHKVLMRAKEEELERYKDMKSRLSTKMLGETLEQHCQNVFNIARSQGGFRSAYFEKDNDASGGTKGDFIFRDYIDGEECLSIMFEMKNEDDRTATKHRNEDFFAKLDKDRREKGCEYAVLVSMLEADSDLYNEGIVDVSYKYEKMYVIRPQFFMSLISLLSQSSRRGAETIVGLRRELSVAKAQSIDVTKFEEKRDRFAAEFMKFIEAHRKKHDEAIGTIDKAIEDAEKQIERLRKIKSLFETSTGKLVRAGEVMENDFTIKKLTHGNPTMKALFADAREDAQKNGERIAEISE